MYSRSQRPLSTAQSPRLNPAGRLSFDTHAEHSERAGLAGCGCGPLKSPCPHGHATFKAALPRSACLACPLPWHAGLAMPRSIGAESRSASLRKRGSGGGIFGEFAGRLAGAKGVCAGPMGTPVANAMSLDMTKRWKNSSRCAGRTSVGECAYLAGMRVCGVGRGRAARRRRCLVSRQEDEDRQAKSTEGKAEQRAATQAGEGGATAEPPKWRREASQVRARAGTEHCGGHVPHDLPREVAHQVAVVDTAWRGQRGGRAPARACRTPELQRHVAF